jgi:hypothetical protein
VGTRAATLRQQHRRASHGCCLLRPGEGEGAPAAPAHPASGGTGARHELGGREKQSKQSKQSRTVSTSTRRTTQTCTVPLTPSLQSAPLRCTVAESCEISPPSSTQATVLRGWYIPRLSLASRGTHHTHGDMGSTETKGRQARAWARPRHKQVRVEPSTCHSAPPPRDSPCHVYRKATPPHTPPRSMYTTGVSSVASQAHVLHACARNGRFDGTWGARWRGHMLLITRGSDPVITTSASQGAAKQFTRQRSSSVAPGGRTRHTPKGNQAKQNTLNGRARQQPTAPDRPQPANQLLYHQTDGHQTINVIRRNQSHQSKHLPPHT